MYAEASDNYYNSVELLNVVGQIDTAALYFSGVAANQGNLSAIAADRFSKCADLGYKAPTTHLLASQALRKEKKFNETKELIIKGRKAFPNDRGLLLELVNISIESGDTKGAESSLVEALAADPTNKQLYYVIGTIYMDLKQNDKAEEALNKAIQLDPDYADAQYQLGAHLYNWAGQLKYEAGQLPENDPSYNQLIEKATKMQYRSLALLESYIIVKPEDKAVLEILRSTYSKLGDSVKASEYKKRIEALKKN